MLKGRSQARLRRQSALESRGGLGTRGDAGGVSQIQRSRPDWAAQRGDTRLLVLDPCNLEQYAALSILSSHQIQIEGGLEQDCSARLLVFLLVGRSKPSSLQGSADGRAAAQDHFCFRAQVM